MGNDCGGYRISPGPGRELLLTSSLRDCLTCALLGSTRFGTSLENSPSEAAVSARLLVHAGRAIADPLGQVLAEAASNRNALLTGYPRNLTQLHSLQSTANEAVHIIHVRASAELIDARRRARGLGAIEQEHPGALARIDAHLEPMIAVAHQFFP